jgi:hypothetical protein
MVSAVKIVPAPAKGVEIQLSAWPENLTINHPSATSIIYPDIDSEHGKFRITHMDAVPSSHKIVAQWETIASKTILKLQKLSLDWAAVECFECEGKRGNMSSTETTVIITVFAMPSITMSLARLMVEIYDIASCRVEIRAGEVGRLAATPSRKYMNEEHLSAGHRVSFSEGLETPVEGTIGGVVELYDGSGVHRDTCVLTCHSYLPLHRPASSTNVDIYPGKLTRL